MVEISFEAEFGWEFGESLVRVHFDAVVCAAALVGRFESAAVGGAGEGEELVETVSHAAKCAAGAIDSAVGPSGFAAELVRFADDLFWDLDDAVEDIADGAAEFALGCVE